MLQSSRTYLTISTAARLAGISSRAVYQIIHKRKVPVEGESIGGKSRYKIPRREFRQWLELEIGRYEEKVRFLKKSLQEL